MLILFTFTYDPVSTNFVYQLVCIYTDPSVYAG